MKSYLLSVILVFCFCLGLNAQNDPVPTIAQKLVLAELKHDFSAFQHKLTLINLDKTNEAVLAEEYSDLIDRMDAQFHTPKVQKTEVINAMVKSDQHNN